MNEYWELRDDKAEQEGSVFLAQSVPLNSIMR